MTTIIPGTPVARQIGLNMLVNELGFEIVTGMKMSRNYSPLALAKQLGFPGRKKIDAIVWLIDNTEVTSIGTNARKALEAAGYEITEVE